MRILLTKTAGIGSAKSVDEFLEEAGKAKNPLIWVAPRSANELCGLFWYAKTVGVDGSQMKK